MAPKQDLRIFLPNLPHATTDSTCVDLLDQFLAYESSLRLSAADALHHPWFTEAASLLLPPGYPEAPPDVRCVSTWEGRTLSDLLLAKLNLAHARDYNTEEPSN